MSFDLPETLDLLRRTPSTLNALLRDIAPTWHALDEGPETWSPLEVVGHLVHGEETDWVPRARIILEHGESRPFDPYDRFAQQRRFGDWSLERLLDRFAELRRENLASVESWNLSEEQLSLSGRHPELGPVQLRQLLAAWAVHDLGHIHQVSRVMAKRYTQEIGVWTEYLTVVGK